MRLDLEVVGSSPTCGAEFTKPLCVVRGVRKGKRVDGGRDDWVACFMARVPVSLPLRDEYFRMKLQWKSVSPEQERRNSLLHGYRSLIGGSRGRGWGGGWGEAGGGPLPFGEKGCDYLQWGDGEMWGSQTPWVQPPSAHCEISASDLPAWASVPHVWMV